MYRKKRGEKIDNILLSLSRASFGRERVEHAIGDTLVVADISVVVVVPVRKFISHNRRLESIALHCFAERAKAGVLYENRHNNSFKCLIIRNNFLMLILSLSKNADQIQYQSHRFLKVVSNVVQLQ